MFKNEVDCIGSEIKKVNLKNYRATCNLSVSCKEGGVATGTGFFMKLIIHNYEFKCLITAEHNIVNDEIWDIEDTIKIDYDDESSEIKLDENERFIKGFNIGFKRENKSKPQLIDILLIEIKDNDSIKDKYFLTNYYKKEENRNINDQMICIIHFPKQRELSESKGKINEMNSMEFKHYASTHKGSSGGPIFFEKTDEIIGVHKGGLTKEKVNVGTYFFQIIPLLEKDSLLKERFTQNLNDNFSKTEINLKYEPCFGINSSNIFGTKFLENNRDNIELKINGKSHKLISSFQLKRKQETNIKLIIKKKLTNLSYMFYKCGSLRNIDDLSLLNTEDVVDFSNLFYGCNNLPNINSLEKWNVSKGKNFSKTFYGCSSLESITPLQNWDCSSGENFEMMFKDCKLKKIEIEGILNKIKNNSPKGNDYSPGSVPGEGPKNNEDYKPPYP